MNRGQSTRDALDLRMIRRAYLRTNDNAERAVLRAFARMIIENPIFDATPESKSQGAACVSIPFEDAAPHYSRKAA